MLLNILEGRVALYNMEKWLARTDAELLFGRNCSSNAFNDTRLAVCLDRIAEHGTDNILAKIVTGFLSRENQSSTRIIHNDTTSIKLLGAHDDPNAQPQPARGHSKDRRPALKQLIFGLALDGAVGVPLTCSMLAGNTSDHTANRLHLDKLARVLPADDEATIVADCKLVDPVTLGKLLIEGFHFVSLLPATYKLRHDLIEQVRVEQTELPELHRSAGRTKASPPRVYRGRSVVRDFKVTWPQTSDDKPADHELVPLRFLVVEPSQRAEQEEAAWARKLEGEHKRFETSMRALTKRTFSCTADALEALAPIVNKLAYHAHHVEIVEQTLTQPRPKRGRPRKDAPPPPTSLVFRVVQRAPLTPHDEAIEKLRFHSRYYVLVSDHVDQDTWPDDRLLAEYRHQHMIEGHTGSRWLKNVAAVAPVLLHSPARIAALGLVFVLALMVRNYVQFTLRRRLPDTGETVPDRLNKPTQSPTTETAFLSFAAATVLITHNPVNGLRRSILKLTEAARTVLRMLDIDESVFTDPPPRIFPSAGPKIPEM